ncbi:MAG: hypothetical protein JWM91_501 [Rhodospirillales bacterium]|nr:hypothetical protein [Rhodospirillales bacterium]
MPPTMRLDEWLPRRESLGMLIDPSTRVIEAYIAEGRSRPGASG